MTRPKFFIIDGNSLCYRAFFAIRTLSNSKGEPTNAIYGFITMLRKLVQEGKPDHIAMCFDRREPTFRHVKYESYKAHRKPMPDDLVGQIEPIKDFCRAYRIPIFEKAGFEADDLIATLAVRGVKQGFDVFIVTGDKDALQLINEHIWVWNPHKENPVFGIKETEKRFDGLGPKQVVDVMALMGDASDNVPGVRGIGEKTAIRLIKQFGSVEELMKNITQVKSKTHQGLLQEHTKDLYASKELVTLDREVPIDISWEEIKVQDPDEAKLTELLQRYEFRTLIKEIQPQAETRAEERDYQLVRSETELQNFVKELQKQKAFSFDTETTSEDPMRAELVGMSFSWAPLQSYYVPVSSSHHQGEGLPLEKVLQKLKSILEDQEKQKYGQNIKYDWMVMQRSGVTIRGIAFDTMIASYLINPIKFNHNLDDISFEYLGIRKIETASLLGKGKGQITMAEVPLEQIKEYACEDADCVFRLVPILKAKLEELDLMDLFMTLELPLLGVLAKIEMNGVSLDLEFLKELSEKAGEDLERLSSEIYEDAGETFNINSTKQLANVLFEQLKLPVIKKTKTGYSTDVSVLEKLAESHDLPKKILEYREKMKLKSTYLDALPSIVNPRSELVHTSYHQTTTATGRLSSSDPNLQNIPIKTEAGRLVRKAFIPRKGNGEKRKMLSADYSQIELRILAHLSEDASLKKAFAEDHDIHRFTATLLYGVEEKEVTREMRNVAKTINFSVIYGKTAYGLSKDLGTSISEADGFIENYFKRYSGVRNYLEAQKELARKQGYLTTFLGRRAYFPDIQSKNMQLRQFAERAAINAPIQGSAADLIKLAMIAIQQSLEKENLKSLMIMQVHDELVFDLLEAEEKKVTELVVQKMESAYKLNVPLKVDVFVGSSWYKN